MPEKSRISQIPAGLFRLVCGEIEFILKRSDVPVRVEKLSKSVTVAVIG